VSCQHNVNNFCNHYKKADPPLHICENCKFFLKEKPECNIHIYSKDWCLFIIDGGFSWKNRAVCGGECEHVR